MKKSEVYSWRLTPELKSRLEDAARRQERSVSGLLERIVESWLDNQAYAREDAERQRRLHRAAAATIGTIRGGDPDRSSRARERLQSRLRESRGR